MQIFILNLYFIFAIIILIYKIIILNKEKKGFNIFYRLYLILLIILLYVGGQIYIVYEYKMYVNSGYEDIAQDLMNVYFFVVFFYLSILLFYSGKTLGEVLIKKRGKKKD